MGSLRVAVAGATGRTGREAAAAIRAADDLDLVGALGRSHGGEDLGSVLGGPAWGVAIDVDLEEMLRRRAPHVLVDFTLGESAGGHALTALRHGVRVVIGATGLAEADVEAIHRLAAETGAGAALIPNFSFGVLLLARFCRQATRFFPEVEVIERHHAAKRDRPSGTARQLCRVLEEAGAKTPVPVHSVRLPGLVAHHEVVFGGLGETLTLRHDTQSRASFGPGVVLAVRRVMTLRGCTDDLAGLLSED